MSVEVATDSERIRQGVRRLGSLVFGDRVGLCIWLGLVAGLGLTWRVGFFIQDSYAVANALVAVADGHLAITDVRYSLTLGSQPGLHEHGGELYGRNYGQVILALPVVWALQAASFVAPLHLVLGGGWSLTMLAFFRQVATALDRRNFRPVGVVLALGAFGVNVLVGRPIDPTLLHVAALQLATILAAAFGGVAFYRLVGLFHSRRVAVAAGVAVVAAFPVGFWASIPKRHVLVTTLLVAGVYCFARSRLSTGRRSHLALAGAYGFVSLVAWVHAFEGFFALAALGVVDVFTGGVRDRRRVVAIACGLVVGLTPMFLTNALISGNPLEPPRLLPNLGAGVELVPGGEVQAAGGGNGGAGSGGGGSDPLGGGSGETGGGGSGQPSPFAALAALLGPLGGAVGKVDYVVGFAVMTVADGIDVLGDPERLWHIFGRSGHVPGLAYHVNQYEVIDLTVLESAPLLGGLLALPAVVARRLSASDGGYRRLAPWNFTPRGQTDLLVVALGCLLAVVYLSRLPLFSQITVRYVVYAMPFWLYGVVRLPPVRESVDSSPGRLGTAFGATAIGGFAVFVVGLTALDVALGEAMQLHALVNLGAAAVVALLVSGRALLPDRVPVRWLAIGLGVTAGLTTVFLVLAGIEYFQYGPYALGISRHLSAAIPVL